MSGAFWPPPGPNWTPKLVRQSGFSHNHWISPTRGIEFRMHKNACEFEKLRKQYGNDDEVLAWNEYRRINYRKNNACVVVNPSQYDVNELDSKLRPEWTSKVESKLGLDWTFKVVWEGR